MKDCRVTTEDQVLERLCTVPPPERFLVSAEFYKELQGSNWTRLHKGKNFVRIYGIPFVIEEE